ncbi:MAG: hypothetical protein MHM6MM_003130 [Cercozoa sp. M6MM]
MFSMIQPCVTLPFFSVHFLGCFLSSASLPCGCLLQFFAFFSQVVLFQSFKMGICSSFVDTSDAPQIDAGEVAKRLLKTLPDLCKDTNQLATDVFPSNVQNASTNGVWAVRGYGADLTKITDDVGYKELTADTRIEDMRSAAVLSAGGIDSRWRRRAYDIVWNEMRYEVNSQLGSKPYPVAYPLLLPK